MYAYVTKEKPIIEEIIVKMNNFCKRFHVMHCNSLYLWPGFIEHLYDKDQTKKML